MNADNNKQGAFAALGGGLARALQWRMLVLWAAGLAIPALVATLPMWQALSARLDHSVHASTIAQRFDFGWMFETVVPMLKDNGDALSGAGIASVLLALLISPWLTGMVVASIRAGDTLRFGNLLQFGLREYGRMARMLLWAAIPLGIAFAIFGGVSGWAEKQANLAILPNGADNAQRIAMLVLGVAFVLAHATVEAGRGMLAAEPSKRSVVKAWWRGTQMFARRPIAVLVVYLGTMLAGEGLALAFAFARTQVTAASVGGFVIGLLLVQLVVAAIAWGRVARLYGMATLARDAQHRHSVRHARRAEAAAHHAATPAAESMTAAAVA